MSEVKETATNKWTIDLCNRLMMQVELFVCTVKSKQLLHQTNMEIIQYW